MGQPPEARYRCIKRDSCQIATKPQKMQICIYCPFSFKLNVRITKWQKILAKSPIPFILCGADDGRGEHRTEAHIVPEGVEARVDLTMTDQTCILQVEDDEN